LHRQVSAAELEKFNDLLQRFAVMTRMHDYLHWRKGRFLPVPESQEQLEIMMRDAPGVMSKETKQRARSMSRGRR
jgi:hypothetical protein